MSAPIEQRLAQRGIFLKRYRPGEHRAPCPQCDRGQKDDALAVKLDHDGATWWCHRCEWTGGLGPEREQSDRRRSDSSVKKRLRAPSRKPTSRWHQWGLDLWDQCSSILPGTPAFNYLDHRCCIVPPGDLRWHADYKDPVSGYRAMTSKRPRKRLDRRDKFVMLPHWFLSSPAWKALPARAKVAYIEAFELRYNGVNNGDIHLSEREAAEIIGCARETASNAIQQLERKGFIRPAVKGRFHVKTRYATRWILTRYEYQGRKATTDFAHWKPEAEFRQRDQNLGQTRLESRPDGLGSYLSGLETSPDSAASRSLTGPDSSPVLVYQGGRSVRTPRGSQRAKAAWLRDHLDTGIFTVEDTASVLQIRPKAVESIAAGKTRLGITSWQRLAALAETKMTQPNSG